MKAYPLKTRAARVLARLIIIGLSARMTLVSGLAADTAENRGQFSAADYKFATAAAQGGMFEVNLGKLAEEKSSDEAVKQFGQHMVDNHGKAGTELGQIASRKGATLPADLTSAQQKQMDRLSGLSGGDFDKAYASYMVRDHKADLKAFQNAAENVQDPDLKAFAANTISMVQEHLKMAEDLETSVKAKLSQNK